MGVRTSPDELTSEALGEDIAQAGRLQAVLAKELVIRAQREDKRSLKLDRFMHEGADGAREKIFYQIYKIERPVTANELIRRLKMAPRTVYYTLRKLTDEGWLKENVGPVSTWELA